MLYQPSPSVFSERSSGMISVVCVAISERSANFMGL